ncbi:MAG: cellulase family glycosylhydrolase [Ignavibacteria bacterium]|jgi:hypothetical protein
MYKIKISYILIFLSFTDIVFSQSINSKYDKWLDPSFFRGYNVLYETPKTLQDFMDFKNCGGNFFQIGTRGFKAEDPPYQDQEANIAGTDQLVNYCRQAGIYYVIAVRSGPGAYDTYLESTGQTGESRIWNTGNTAEQSLYGDMLTSIVQRYAGDSLFVGLNLVVEPRPKVKYIAANTSELYKSFLETIYNIHMDAVYSAWIAEIRTIDSELPIITENFAYSTPELFPAYVMDDPFIVYSAHNYMPKEYTSAAVPYTLVYPGTYWNITYLSQQYYDKTFLQQVVFGRLKSFQGTTGGAPVLLGEFGIMLPQGGCYQYISDVADISIANGWHFSLWVWRGGLTEEWNYEMFREVNLSTFLSVLERFQAPPIPQLIFPADSAVVGSSVTFRWDSLTAYNAYDIMIEMGDHIKIVVENIKDANYTVSGLPVKPGHVNFWKVRSKNPGLDPASWSDWSAPRAFIVDTSVGYKMKPINSPIEFHLSQNYPNPFNPETKIDYSVPKNSMVKLVIYDVLGREIKTLLNEVKSAGMYTLRFDGSSLPSGIYIYRINIIPLEGNNSYTSVKKMVLLK